MNFYFVRFFTGARLMANPPPGAIFSTDLSFDVTISFGSYMIQGLFFQSASGPSLYIVAMYLIPGSRKKSTEIVRAFSSVIPPTNQLEAFFVYGPLIRNLRVRRQDLRIIPVGGYVADKLECIGFGFIILRKIGSHLYRAVEDHI